MTLVKLIILTVGQMVSVWISIPKQVVGLRVKAFFYHPYMREDNVFILSVCLSAIIFECLDLEASFLVCWYILTISRSDSNTKVICQGHYGKIGYFDY